MLLDTCVISEMAKPTPNAHVLAWMAAHHAQARLSVVVLGEIACGIALLPTGQRRRHLETWLSDLEQRFADRILPIDPPVAHAWATLHAARQQAGRPLAMADGLIAATAQVHALTVATRNRVDFSGLVGVQVADPWAG